MARILVAGAGALGLVFGGFLRRAGHEVTLLGRSKYLDPIERSGLFIDGLWGEHRVSGFTLIDVPPSQGVYDAILITVKSYDSAALARSLSARLADDGTAISLQNGLGNVEALAAAFAAERVLGGRVIFGSTVVEPGHVRVTVFAEPTLLGAWTEPSSERARHWAGELDRAGIPTESSAGIRTALWGKVFYSAALNPLGALLGVHYGALPEMPDARSIMDGVIDEAFAVARAEGVELPWPTSPAYREQFYGRLVPSTYDHRSSMLQDLERGRRTEIDAINGAVWKCAEAHGMNASFNQMLTRLMHAREAVGMARLK